MVFLQAHIHGIWISIVSFFTLFGQETFMIAIMAYLYYAYDKLIGKYVGVCLMVANVLNPMIKNVALRRRPYMDNDEIQCLKAVSTDGDIMDVNVQGFSMPSGHTTSATVLYSSISYYIQNKRMAVASGILIWLVAFSRVVLGVHYPTDVLAGMACGIFVVFIIPFLRVRMTKKEYLYALIAILMLPGFFYCKTTDFYTSYGMMIGFFIGDRLDTRIVRFKNTNSFIRGVLRVVGGAAIYFGLNTILKLPFSSDFLNSATTAAYLVRTIRYAIVVTVMIGVYPMCFDKIPIIQKLEKPGKPARNS